MVPATTALKKPASQTRRSAKTVNPRDRKLEERERLRDAEFSHLAERTRTAAEAGVQIGIARMETGVQGRLVELDLALKAVESGGTPPASRRLPSQ